MKSILLILTLFLSQLIGAQSYNTVDSIVANYPNQFKNIKAFADRINNDFSTDLDKTRAAYYWIANHVYYDYPALKRSRSGYSTYKDEADLLRIQRNYAEKVIRRKRGVCEGYSQLLRFTLQELGVQCEVVSGFAKNSVNEIGIIRKESDHAWNAVFIDGRWQLLDATWSTGNVKELPNVFEFDDAYFLISPEILIWSHYPEDKKWQLLKKPPSSKAFFYAPVIYDGYYNSGLELTKMNGLIKSKKDYIEISFDTITTDESYRFRFGGESLIAKKITFIEKNGKYITQIPYKKGELIIFGPEGACLSFKIFKRKLLQISMQYQ